MNPFDDETIMGGAASQVTDTPSPRKPKKKKMIKVKKKL